MVCHKKLARTGSNDFSIVLGASLGALFVTIIAPLAFFGYWEFQCSVFLIYILGGFCHIREFKIPELAVNEEEIDAKGERKKKRKEKKLLDKLMKDRDSVIRKQKIAKILWIGGGVILLGTPVCLYLIQNVKKIDRHRGFYGVLNVDEKKGNKGLVIRNLYDGPARRGSQMMAVKMRKLPTVYYKYQSGIKIAAKNFKPDKDLHFGVIGLGLGTVAAYTKTGYKVRFYENSLALEKTVKKNFFYLTDSKGEVELMMGDVRRSLESELEASGGQNFHILVLDTFNGHAIPTHLLTREAFSLYWKHLRPEGIMVVHITNKFFDLSPVIRNHAKFVDKEALRIFMPPDKYSSEGAEWVIITSNKEFLKDTTVKQAVTPWADKYFGNVVWTDEYSNYLKVLRLPKIESL